MSKKSTLKIEFPETEEEIAQILYGEDSNWIYTRDDFIFDNKSMSRNSKRRKLDDIPIDDLDLDEHIDKLTTQIEELNVQREKLKQKKRKYLHGLYNVVYRIRCKPDDYAHVNERYVGVFSSIERANSVIPEGYKSECYDDFHNKLRTWFYSIVVDQESTEDEMDELDECPPNFPYR